MIEYDEGLMIFTAECDTKGCDGEAEFVCCSKSDGLYDLLLDHKWIRKYDKHYCSSCADFILEQEACPPGGY
jgi:hypothetical protein